MGLFSRILEKLGIDRKDDDAFGSRPYESTGAGSAGSGGSGGTGTRPGFGNVSGSVRGSEATAGGGGGGGGGGGAPIPEVDVMARLEQKAAGKDLNWKTSIVDLLKLLDLDSSLPARRELADELDAPSTLADGSAEMNTWLHREVLRRVAANGGNVPRELFD